MRINKYIAHATRLSRRGADTAIAEGRVEVNDKTPERGADIGPEDVVTINGRPISSDVKTQTIMLHKPAGYICSRDGQGSLTVFDLLPPEYQHLNPIGRLDKDSSGLLLLTNDGQLAQELTHPSHKKPKIYEVVLDHDLSPEDFDKISKQGVQLRDGMSKFDLEPLKDKRSHWIATLREGRNRQVRRTFMAADYDVINLHRIGFGDYKLGNLTLGEVKSV